MLVYLHNMRMNFWANFFRQIYGLFFVESIKTNIQSHNADDLYILKICAIFRPWVHHIIIVNIFLQWVSEKKTPLKSFMESWIELTIGSTSFIMCMDSIQINEMDFFLFTNLYAIAAYALMCVRVYARVNIGIIGLWQTICQCYGTPASHSIIGKWNAAIISHRVYVIIVKYLVLLLQCETLWADYYSNEWNGCIGHVCKRNWRRKLATYRSLKRINDLIRTETRPLRSEKRAKTAVYVEMPFQLICVQFSYAKRNEEH